MDKQLKPCRVFGQQFEVAPEDLEFLARVSPVVGETQLQIPPPTLCPHERQRRRLSFRNERYLYRRTCAVSGKSIVSIYSPEKQLKVCDKPLWLELDNTQFGRDFDFSRPFFEQFAELAKETYKANVIQAGEMLNSEYTHFTGWLKNCYVVFDSGKSEDCMYGLFVAYCKNCLDCTYLSQCELCYESVRLENCYHLMYSRYCKNCSFSAYLHDCIGCKNCLCSANLRNKEYYYQNSYVGPERFKQLWTELFCGSWSKQQAMRRQFDEFLLSVPHRATRSLNSEDCSGDELFRCSNVHDSYNCYETKDCRYVYDIYKQTNDCYDVGTFGECMAFCYEVGASGGTKGKAEVSNLFFSNYIFYGGYNILYSSHCHENCQNLFGCSDLNRKQYCILNKQYTKADYERLVPRIVEHMRQTEEWGEFFPISLSPFGYNESLAAEFYPASQNEVQRLGGTWSDYKAPLPQATGFIQASEVPDKIQNIRGDITALGIVCSSSKRPFRITEQELLFYQMHQLPLPRLHAEDRSKDRIASLNPRQIWIRPCSACNQQVETSFSPSSPQQIVCEACFLQATQ